MTQNTAGVAARSSGLGSDAAPKMGSHGDRGTGRSGRATFSKVRTSRAAFLERTFVPRDFTDRWSDRFGSVRLATRAQRIAAAASIIVLVWGCYATAGFVMQMMTIVAKDREIARQRQAYLDLEQELRQAVARKAELETHIVGLKINLAGEVERRVALQEQRDALERRGLRLEQSLVDLRESKQQVIDRLIDRVKRGSEAIEKAVAMTGLDAGTLNADPILPSLRQGGPFVDTVDKITAFHPSIALASRATDLDQQLNRWAALQQVVRSLPITTPLDQYWISSGYGVRRDPITGRKARHLGVDFAAELNSGVLATAPGKVVFAGWKSHYGRTIQIDHGHGIETLYGHLSKINVKTGDHVGHQQKIGLLGSSGRSTGPHLHYEIRFNGEAQDPMKFLKAGKHIFKE